MIVIVDTPVWSLALRRRHGDLSETESVLRHEFTELIREGRVLLLGPVRQEILSGIRDAAQFRRLRDSLRAFPDEPLTAEDFEQAASFNNDCRRAGIAGSAIDFLLCAVADRRSAAIFTTDQDFVHFAKRLPIHLHKSRRPEG